PGIYAVYALILAASGQTPAGIHLGLLVVNVVTMALLFLVARRHCDARVAVVAAAAFAALSLSPRLLSTAAYAEHFVLPPVLAGLLILPRAIDRRRMATYLGSGALFGTAFVVKQSAGAFLLFAVLYVLLGMRDDTRLRLGASLLATSAGLYFRPQYFVLLLPALAILTGVAVDAVARRLASVRARALRYGIPIVLATVPLLHLVYLERTILFTDTPHEVS